MGRMTVVLLVVFTAALAWFSSASFAFNAGSQEVAVTLSESYVSSYIWRGQDLYADNDAAHQPSIDIALPGLFHGTDVSVNIWGSFPLSGGHEDAEEMDYTITFSRDIGKLLNLSSGYTYFDYPNTAKTADVQEPWLSATLNKLPLLPLDVWLSVFAGYDFQVASGGPDEGWYYSWGFGTALPLPRLSFFQEEQTLELGLVNWGNDGVADLKSDSLYATELSAATSYAFKGFSVTPNVHYTLSHEDSINRDDELWGGVQISYAF
ncbi:MAG: hypothetical protein PHR44_01960 [Candidatus Omnitrophica bacterium]|nr:hypothetical protein [Candidatus Omnitrophota bacterium]